MSDLPTLESAEVADLAEALTDAAVRLRYLADSIGRAADQAREGTCGEYASLAGNVLHEINSTLMNLMVPRIVRSAARADVARSSDR